MSQEKHDLIVEGTEPEPIETETVVSAISRAEVSQQIATARAYPRSINQFWKDALEMVMLDKDSAGKMYYRLKRRGKDGVKIIEGPSIRLAEVAVAAWGHTYWGSRPVARDETVVRCQGIAWDMQKNNRRLVEVTRRITTTDGHRYSEDMITVTEQAASQIAARNAVFGVIPRVYVDSLVKKAKEVFIGEAGSIAEKRIKAIEEFAKIGVRKEDVFKISGKQGFEDLTIDDLIDLRGLLTAIEEGQITIQEVLAGANAEETTVSPKNLSPESFTKDSKVEGENEGESAKPKRGRAKPKPSESKKQAADTQEETPKDEPTPTQEHPSRKAPPVELPPDDDDGESPEDAAVDDLFK